MLGRGVKRKWSFLQEPEAESLLAAEKEQPGADGREDERGFDSHLSRLQQRQRVLGLCVEKLRGYQAGVELSLRRSVLLVNTLRQIQEDVRHDGGQSGQDAAPTCPGCAEGDRDGGDPARAPSPESPDQQKALPAFGEAVSAVGYLGDLALDTDVFEDIDTSMCETSDLPSAWAGSLWPLSVSLWADEDAKVRPVQSCLVDLNELDHIMEILVKS